MKTHVAGLAALALIASGSYAFAQDDANTTTTVTHRDASGQNSSTVVQRPDGSTTEVQRSGETVKKTYTDPNGDQTIVKKTPAPPAD